MRIPVRPYKTTGQYIQVDNAFILSYSMLEIGFLQKYDSPIIIGANKEQLHFLDIQKNKMIEENKIDRHNGITYIKMIHHHSIDKILFHDVLI